MRGVRGFIIFPLCLLAFHFPAYASEGSGKELQAQESPEEGTLDSFFRYLMSTGGDKEDPLDTIFDFTKRMLMALSSPEDNAEELRADLDKSLNMQKQREEIIEKIKELSDAYDAGMTPEQKGEIKTKLENSLGELKDSMVESLKLILEAVGLKAEDAERIMQEDRHLARFFLQLQQFMTSQLDPEGASLR